MKLARVSRTQTPMSTKHMSLLLAKQTKPGQYPPFHINVNVSKKWAWSNWYFEFYLQIPIAFLLQILRQKSFWRNNLTFYLPRPMGSQLCTSAMRGPTTTDLSAISTNGTTPSPAQKIIPLSRNLMFHGLHVLMVNDWKYYILISKIFLVTYCPNPTSLETSEIVLTAPVTATELNYTSAVRSVINILSQSLMLSCNSSGGNVPIGSTW